MGQEEQDDTGGQEDRVLCGASTLSPGAERVQEGGREVLEQEAEGEGGGERGQGGRVSSQ